MVLTNESAGRGDTDQSAPRTACGIGIIRGWIIVTRRYCQRSDASALNATFLSLSSAPPAFIRHLLQGLEALQHLSRLRLREAAAAGAETKHWLVTVWRCRGGARGAARPLIGWREYTEGWPNPGPLMDACPLNNDYLGPIVCGRTRLLATEINT